MSRGGGGAGRRVHPRCVGDVRASPARPRVAVCGPGEGLSRRWGPGRAPVPCPRVRDGPRKGGRRAGGRPPLGPALQRPSSEALRSLGRRRARGEGAAAGRGARRAAPVLGSRSQGPLVGRAAGPLGLLKGDAPAPAGAAPPPPLAPVRVAPE